MVKAARCSLLYFNSWLKFQEFGGVMRWFVDRVTDKLFMAGHCFNLFQGFRPQVVYYLVSRKPYGHGSLPAPECRRNTNTNPNIMKSIIKNLTAAAFAAALITSVSAAPPSKGSLEATNQATAQQYTCPMHPEVVKDAPGNCPKCGMKLVEKTAAKEAGKGCGSGCGKH